MKSTGFFLVLLLASGCATSPGMSSAQHRFRKEHPDAEIVAQTANDATEHTGYWPHSTTRHYVDYTFRYRGADGVEHEDVYHYKYLNRGWSVEKEQTR
jgi:hypothetical protein